MQAPAKKIDSSPLAFTVPIAEAYARILTPEAVAFVTGLAEKFTARRDELLRARTVRQKEIDAGKLPDFLPETKAIREGEWRVAPIPADLQDRRVEITGPVERKMIINALNSGAKVFMADFEDSLTPAWDKVMEGQINLQDAVRRTISFASPEGKTYALNEKTAVLIVRPRGWHLDEKHVLLNGQPIPGALLDFGLYFFHNARELLARGSGPYFYLPKLENHREAQLWGDIFAHSEDALGIPRGTIKATVLIEVITATFEMHEILHALKDYCVGLNCGRWDYIFSYIKKFAKHKDRLLPDRGKVVMTTPFLRAYSLLLIQTCHKRGAFAMGGMSAYIPVKGNEEANAKAFAMVKADKEREAGDGHDGTWVAHPGLVPVAMEAFNRLMPGKNQLDKLQAEVRVTAAELIAPPEGTITEAGVRNNISVSLQYVASWLSGLGCVPINNLMEDAATAEIARAQLWQWIHHEGGVLEDGGRFTPELFKTWLNEEWNAVKARDGATHDAPRYAKAAALLEQLVTPQDFTEFLTLPGYREIG